MRGKSSCVHETRVALLPRPTSRSRVNMVLCDAFLRVVVVSAVVFRRGIHSNGEEYSEPYDSAKDVEALIYLPWNEKYPFSYMKLQVAYEMARKKAYDMGLVPRNFTWRMSSADSGCHPKHQAGVMLGCMTILKTSPFGKSLCKSSSEGLAGLSLPNIIFGPVCSYAVSQVARSAYTIPLVTIGGYGTVFRSKENDEFHLVTRAGFRYRQAIELLVATMNKFSWKKAVFVYSRKEDKNHIVDYRFCNLFYKSIADILSTRRTNIKRACRWNKYGNECQNRAPDVEIEEEFYDDDPGTLSNSSSSSRLNYTLNTTFKTVIGNNFAVVVLCADPDSVRKIMLKAEEMNFINGEYVFFNIDLFSSKNQSVRPWFREGDKQETNDKARRAYRALMTVTLKKPDNAAYRNFSDQVKKLAKQQYNYTYGDQEVNSFVGAFHDSVMLYALALNDTLAAGGRIDDGLNITKRMWNRTFVGITGNVSIDANGDRNADYSLLDMNKATGDFEVVANYYGNTKQYSSVDNKEIDWVNVENKAPPDVPPCGFDGTGCPDNNTLNGGVIAAIIMASLIAIALIVGFIVYRRMKFQAQLEAMNWLIPWEELETQERRNRRRTHSKRRIFPKDMDSLDKELAQENHFLLSEGQEFEEKRAKSNEKGGREEKGFRSTFVREFQNRINSKRKHRSMNGSLQSFNSKSASSLDTIAGIQLSMLQSTQMFTKTSFFKDQLVALKKINLRSRKIDINRELLIEVKKIKDMNNDHIARFIGACIETPNECIITEYCPKGSLQDVLENEQINLDWMFKFSLMQDICRGMMYLQNNLGPHGNLKSSNCLVDSRFVLKITDFALQSLRGPTEPPEEEDSYSYYRNKLWTAPELLRINSNRVQGTVKGDIYSFAIVCQEIVYRKGVFYLVDQNLEPKEICDRVKMRDKPYFRPTLDSDEGCSEDMVRIISNAWAEDPTERPEFSQIKIQMKKINKGGDSENLLDNLLSRMEQYANNLEGLVAQRTEQYFEEKKKAEDLLYMMLPKSVAGQLIRGEPVTAEAFDKVTIYFSDICGFTSLSAESTPWQVISLLNDLYTLFDSIIENFDCYKVETIGDAYMVVSGLPQRNGNLHAREVARMALTFLANIFKFKIRHRPDRQLELRIGIHSGHVIAGVVGLKMPRYCLFGDTVNMASRMESTGQPLRIHCSQATKDVLDTFGSFQLAQRGYVEMKGKGRQFTYWLVGENGEAVDRTGLGDISLESSDKKNSITPPPSYHSATTVNPQMASILPPSHANPGTSAGVVKDEVEVLVQSPGVPNQNNSENT